MKLDPQLEVQLCECFGRDGLQSFPTPLDTEDKVAIISRIIESGFPKVEVTSFVPPQHVPQFHDAAEVLRRIPRPEGVRLLAFIPNARGAQSAAECCKEGYGPTDLLIVVSASEAHNQKNLNRTREQTMEQHKAIVEIAGDAGMNVIGSISTSFGCPYTGEVPRDEVHRLIDHYLSLGINELQFGDTTGMAQPIQVQAFFEDMAQYEEQTLIAHFHDVRGVALTNTLVAMECGVRAIDLAFGGTGGRPHYQRLQDSGPTGNLCTEDFVALLAQMGYQTGIDPQEMLDIGAMIEDAVGEKLFSHTLRSGLATTLKP